MRKKTLAEIMREHAQGIENVSAYTDEPLKKSSNSNKNTNSNVKTQVEQLYKKSTSVDNTSQGIWDRIQARAKNIMDSQNILKTLANTGKIATNLITKNYVGAGINIKNILNDNQKENSISDDAKNVGENYILGTKKAGKSSLYYIQNASEENNPEYKRIQQNVSMLRDKQEQNEAMRTGKFDEYMANNPYIKSSKDVNGIKINSYNSSILTGLDKSIQKDEEKIQQNIENTKNPIAKKIAELTPSIAQSVTGMGLSAVNPALGMSFWQTSAGGDYTRDAKAKGLNDKDAMLYGTIMGSLESGTEWIGGKLTTGVGKAISKDGTVAGLKALGLDIGENFFEEAIMEPLQETVMSITGGKDKADWNNMGERMLESGINGALTSILMGGVSAGLGKSVNLVTKMENKEQITQKEVKDALKEINDQEELDIEKILVDSFGFNSQDLYKNTDVQKKVDSKIENMASQLSKEETRNILPQNPNKNLINNSELNDNQKQKLTEISEKYNLGEKDVQNLIDNTLNGKYEENQVARLPNNDLLKNNQQTTLIRDKSSQNQLSSKLAENSQNAIELTEENRQKLENTLKKEKYVNNERAKQFFESAVNNDLDLANEKIEALFDLPDKRGVQTKFDTEIFKDSAGNVRNNINALYITDREGNRSILYNPKAIDESVVEKNTIHETFHDMAGTQEANEIIDFVYNRMKEDTDFQNSFNELKEAYANVKDNDGNILYNTKSVEFENMIKEEAVADYLGTNLGNQEYINELVNGKESRNIAQKIYDAIVKFFDKVKGYKSEEAFLRGLKDKFEKAFNAEYNTQNQVINKFSIQTDSNGNKYVKVDTDQDIFEGVAKKDYNKIAKMYIKDYLMGETTLAGTDTAKIDSRSANKYTNPGKRQQYFKEKMQLTPELKNVLKIAQKETQALPSKENSKYSSWEYYKFNFELSGKTFEGVINIGIDSQGNKHFYEINKIKETVDILGTSLNNSSTASSINNSIPQSKEKGNTTTKYSIQKNKNNAGLENNSSSFSLPQNENVLVNTKGKKIDISNLQETAQMKVNTYNRKYNKENITAYRGTSENTGNNGAFYGLGLYTTLDKKYASKYGDVEIVDNSLLPDNPIKFKTQNDFEMWKQDLASQLGIRYSELEGSDYGIEKYITKLGYDGLMIGSGKDTDLISFKESIQKNKKLSQNKLGSWESFLERNKINKGTTTTLGELRLPEAKRNLPAVKEIQFQDTVNNAKYIPKEVKTELLSELEGVEKNNKTLKEFKQVVTDMENTYKEIDNDLLKKQTYNSGNKEIYQSYLKATNKYDTKAINNALNIVKPNSQGRRTKEQWINVAKQIGTEISNKSNKEIQEIAFRSWQDLRPNSKENLNRQGKKYVDFNSDTWVNTIYEQVEQSRMRFSITKDNNNVILPGSKKIEINRKELPSDPNIYDDENIRAFKYATDNIDNIEEYSDYAPPDPPDVDTKKYISKKRTKEKLKPREVLDSLTQSFVNKGHYIDKLAKETGNKNLTYKYDRTLSTFNEAQYSIGEEQVNSKGEIVGESLLDIFKPVEEAKLSEDFEDYLLNKHNIARTAVGKSIYGDDVSAPQNKKKVEQYEKKYPQFKEWAEKVSKYNQNTLRDMVDTGMITENTYKNLRLLYGDYIPTYRDIIEERTIADDGNIGSNVLGKATKSNLKILSPKESMAEQTLAVKKAIRMNELGKELYKTLGKGSQVFEGIEFDTGAIQTLGGEVIEKAQDGTNTFTIFIDGKMTQFKISDELYSAFSKDTLQARIKNNKGLNALLTPVEKLSKAQRNLLTTYSIGFAFNNPIKDLQDAVFNTKYSVARFSKNYVKALYQRATKGEYYKQYIRNGGAGNTYFEYDKGLLPQKSLKLKKIVEKVQTMNEILEMTPRLAEYISTIEKGGSIDEAMYNASEITTNFKRGGDITKAINKYGANFLNASVQGLDKQIRNITGQNGIKGYANLLTRTAILGVLPSVINHLLLDDDEDYQDLPDYIKDSYYLLPSSEEKGKFIRIPKGRVLATIGTTARNIVEFAEGEKDIEKTVTGSIGGILNNLAPNNPMADNLAAPMLQAKNNKAWYGGEIEGSRLQLLPIAERTDEKTDELSNKISNLLQSNDLTKYIADKLGISPKKINYVIDQYSGGLGDVLLPMATPYAETNILEDKFTTSSMLKNKNVETFYTALKNAELSNNSEYATDTDKLEYKYLSGISKDVGKLYGEKRDIQNSNLSDKEKKEQTKEIQSKINNIVKEALNTLESAKITNSTANFNGTQYYKDEEDEWKAIKEEDIPKGLSTETYADYKNKLAQATEEKKKREDDEDATLTTREKNSLLKSATYTDKEKKEIYSNILGKNDDDYKYLSKLEDINIEAYLDYKTQEIKADDDPESDIVGKTISGSKKENLIEYLNSNDELSNLDKIYILGKSYKLDSSQRAYIQQIVDNSDLTAEEKKEFYKNLSSSNIEELEDGTIRWKK